MFAFARKLVSSIEQQAQGSASDFQNHPELGLRVLSVQSSSLAARFGFESWFDFIIKINDYEITIFLNEEGILDHTRFLQFINNLTTNKQNLTFQVWSAKGGIQRLITVPFVDLEKEEGVLQEVNLSQSQDSSNTVVNSNPPFANLGLAIQVVPLVASTYTWHILETHPNSPAYRAGLLPQSDYIIGAQDGLLAFGGEHLLTRVIASRYEKQPHDCSIVLYVYNHDFDVVRPVTIQPTLNWGGPGLLGCNVGYGLLHRVPEVVGKFSGLGKEDEFLDDDDFYVDDFDLAPGKTLFSSNSENVFIPSDPKTYTKSESPDSASNVPSASTFVPPPPQSSAVRSKKKPSSAKANSADLASYFDEETKRSKDLDRDVSSKKESSGLPPPPPPPPAASS